MPKRVRILLTGGGSGGHIIPNLAVASAIKSLKPNVELLYISSRGKLDAKLLKDSGLKVRRIFSGKLRRYLSWRHLVDPFLVVLGFLQSLFILWRFKPKVVFSKGGYVSLPVVLAAKMLRIRVVMHESDSRMGIANRIAARVADTICVAFPELLHSSRKAVLTGNPIRSNILGGMAKHGYELTGFSERYPTLLIWGGSQGAAQINNLVKKHFHQLTEHFQVVHVTGIGKSIHKDDHHYKHYDYIGEELKHVYAITDMIIGRAGANSIFEVALLQKPNIMIPLKNEDQLKNAKYFEQEGATIIRKDGQKLFELADELWQNDALKDSMKKALRKLSTPHAAEDIAHIILK